MTPSCALQAALRRGGGRDAVPARAAADADAGAGWSVLAGCAAGASGVGEAAERPASARAAGPACGAATTMGTVRELAAPCASRAVKTASQVPGCGNVASSAPAPEANGRLQV